MYKGANNFLFAPLKNIMKISPINIYGPIKRNSNYLNTVNRFRFTNNCTTTNFESLPLGPISFGYNFALKNATGIPCAYCGKEMLSRKDVEQLIKLKGVNLVNRIECFVNQDPDAINQNTLDAIRFFEEVALANPDKNGNDILPIAYLRARSNMIEKQLSVYSRISELAKAANSQELDEYIRKVQTQDCFIAKDITASKLSNFLQYQLHIQFRKDVILKIIKLSSGEINTENVDLWEKIIKTATELPSSKNDPHAYLVKYISKALRKDPGIESEYCSLNESEAMLFYMNLLKSYVSSVEHVKPNCENGDSLPSNYLATHSYCNCKRGSKKFSDFIVQNPSVLDNILKNLRYVSLNKSIAFKTFGFKPAQYLMLIKLRLEDELRDIKNRPEIDAFLKKLDSINLLSDDTYFSFSDALTAKYTKEMLDKVITISNPDERNAEFDKLYEQCIARYIAKRQDKLANIIRYCKYPENKALIAYIGKLKKEGVPGHIFSQPPEALNYSISDNFIFNNKTFVASEIYRILQQGQDEVDLEYCHTLSRKLSLKKTPELCCIKILINSKKPDGTYDISKMTAYFNSLKVID